MEGFTMPLTKIDAKKPILQPFEGFVRPKQSGVTEHEDLSNKELSKHFGPKAYKLLVNAGYNPQESSMSRSHLEKTDNAGQNSKAGLGYTVQSPVRIAIKRAATNYTSTQQTLESSNIQTVSVFKMMGRREAQRVSVFKRLGKGKSWKRSKTKGSDELHITEKWRSLIPPRMKRYTTLIMSCGKKMKARMKTTIFTRDAIDQEDRESVASSYYTTNSASNPVPLPHTTQSQVRREIASLVRSGVITTSVAENLAFIRQRNESIMTCFDCKDSRRKDEDDVTANHITSCEKMVVGEENSHLSPKELETLDEERLEVQQKLEYYQALPSRSFNKAVRAPSFQIGDMALAARRPIVITLNGKFLKYYYP